MKTINYLILIVIALLFSCDKDDFTDEDCITGAGMVVAESRDIGNFHSILNSVYADIMITQGPVEEVLIEAQSNILDKLETKVYNGELVIETDRCIDIDQAIRIFITIPDIRKLSLIGAGDFIAENAFDLDGLEVVISGSGMVYLQGKATSLEVSITGVGDINAYEMNVDECKITITGVGNVEGYVNNILDVTISGVGSVYYKGTPTVNSTITGTGNVINGN